MKVMAKLKLQAKQRVAYKITTKRKHSDAVVANLLNQNFNPVAQDQIWAGDITYLKNSRRQGVLGGCDGSLFPPYCWLGNR